MSADVTVVGEYYRNQRGDVVHLVPCPRMGAAVRWNWADGKGLREIAGFVNAADWMRLCRSCWPSEAFAADAASGGDR